MEVDFSGTELLIHWRVFNVHTSYITHLCTYIHKICILSIGHICTIVWAYMYLSHIWPIRDKVKIAGGGVLAICEIMLDPHLHVHIGCVSYISYVGAIFAQWCMSNIWQCSLLLAWCQWPNMWNIYMQA